MPIAGSPLIVPDFGIASGLAATLDLSAYRPRGADAAGGGAPWRLGRRRPRAARHHRRWRPAFRAADRGGEAGPTGRTAISVGGWTYSRRQPRVAPPGVSFRPATAVSHGLYAILERDLMGMADRPGHWRAFLRAGLSDGLTTPFGDGLQLGVTGRGVLPRRPGSLVSLGLATAGLSRPYRRANPPDEAPLTRAESMVELTVSDRVAPFLTLQPDLQFVRHPGGLRDAPDLWVVGLRAIIDWKAR